MPALGPFNLTKWGVTMKKMSKILCAALALAGSAGAYAGGAYNPADPACWYVGGACNNAARANNARRNAENDPRNIARKICAGTPGGCRKGSSGFDPNIWAHIMNDMRNANQSIVDITGDTRTYYRLRRR